MPNRSTTAGEISLSTESETDSSSIYEALEMDIKTFQNELYAQIEKEVHERRSQGEYPPAFELAMDKAFKRHAPHPGEASVYSAEHLLDMVEATGYIDIAVPTTSSTPGVAYLKLFVKKLTAWYFNYIAQQLSNFVVNLVHLLRVIHVRLDKLEKRVYELYPEIIAADLPPSLGLSIYDLVQKEIELTSVKGRLLVTECASGDALKTISDLGLDVYGIDHREKLLENRNDRLDIRWETLSHHVKSLALNSLAAVVLQGSFELRSAHDKADILATLSKAIKPNGLLLLLHHEPSISTDVLDLTVAKELAPGRLFSEVTWRHMLNLVGFQVISHGAVPPLDKDGVLGNYLLARLES